MAWLPELLQTHGAALLIGAGLVAGWVVWMLATDRLIAVDQHTRELAAEREITEAERAEKEWWREAAMTSSEMGKMLTEVKAVERRDQ